MELEREIAAARALAEAGLSRAEIARILRRAPEWVTGAMGIVLDMLCHPDSGADLFLTIGRLASVEAWQAYCALPAAARRVVIDSVDPISVDLCRAALESLVSSAVRSGRPRRLTDERARHAARRLADGETDTDVAADLRVSRATLYRAIRRVRKGSKGRDDGSDGPMHGGAGEEPDPEQPGHRGMAGPPCLHCGKDAHAAMCVDRPSDTWRVTCYVCGDLGPPGFGIQGAYAKWSELAPAAVEDRATPS